MTLWKKTIFVALWFLATSLTASAQLERVVAEAEGIT